MPIFSRKISKSLATWSISETRRPLLLRGARQIGKSFAVQELAKTHYKNFYVVNFERNPSLKKIFEGDLDPQNILSELSLIWGKEIQTRSDLIFFDEIQECPRAILALRYFYEQANDYHVIAAGSLLEFALERVSIPVGRIMYEYMYPLCFSEFLAATNRQHLIAHLPRFGTSSQLVASETAHTLLSKAMKEYFIIGGMPAVVDAFVSTGSFQKAAEIQDIILQTFRDDIHKYTKGDLQIENLEKLLGTGIKHVGKQVKYSTLIPEVDTRRTKKSLELLEKACLLHRIASIRPNGLPLGAEASDKHFKLIFLDIGLGQRWSGFSTAEIIADQNLLDVYEGRLAEQFVAQQLLAESDTACEGRHLYCWIRTAKSATAEVDFILVRNGVMIGVEVKSGPSGKLKSMYVLQELFPHIKDLLCLQDRSNTVTDRGILSMPIYTVL